MFDSKRVAGLYARARPYHHGRVIQRIADYLDIGTRLDRVLRSRGWLVIYDSFFSANLHGSPGFKPWFTSTYLARFPTPPRNNRPPDNQSAEQAGFQLLKQEKYTNVVFFDQERLVNYLLTQTNVIAAIERGSWTLDEVRAYLTAKVSSYFPSPAPQAFDFGGPIIFLRKAR